MEMRDAIFLPIADGKVVKGEGFLLSSIVSREHARSLRYNTDYVLVGDIMAQPDALRHVARTRAPDHGVFERLLERAVDLVADVFDGAAAADNQGFAEVGVDAFSFPSPILANKAQSDPSLQDM